jgi:hypothetical protein
VAFLASTAAVTRNGPYGQADWVVAATAARPSGTFKDIVPSGTRYTVWGLCTGTHAHHTAVRGHDSPAPKHFETDEITPSS